jgi:hypothetical protein
VNSAVIADYSTGSSVITKSPKIRSQSSSGHKRVLNLTADDDRLPPLAHLKNSISSADEGYHANSRLSLTKDAKQEVTATKKSSSEHKRVSSKPTTDDDDNDCLPLGASHNFLDSSIANNPQDELFEQLYEMDLNGCEMDLNDNDDFNGAHRSSNGKPSHSSKEGSKRKSRTSGRSSPMKCVQFGFPQVKCEN